MSAHRSLLIGFFIFGVLIILLLPFVFLSQLQQTAQKKATTHPPAVYFGVFTVDNFWNLSTLFPFETHAGKQAAIVMDYQDWDFELNDAASYFSPSWMNQVRSYGSIPMVTWEPQNYQKGVNQPTYQLRNIYNGKYDAYLRKWAQDAKNWGHPFFLRFAQEMNGNWYPWDEQVNSNQSGDFVKAWRHVHDIFVANGATNVTWVWSPNVESSDTSPLAELYPGDSYVDWVGMDGYNFGYDGWRTFSQTFHQTYADLQQIAPTKPIMVAEMASAEQGGSKASWITDAYALQIPTFFPKIEAVIWFNTKKERDWRIESSASALHAFAQAISSSYYASNQFGKLNTSPIPPLQLLSSSSLSSTQSQPTIPLSTPIPTHTELAPFRGSAAGLPAGSNLRKRSKDYPKELTALEMKEMLYGPFAYLLSRIAASRIRKKFVMVEHDTQPFTKGEDALHSVVTKRYDHEQDEARRG